MSSTRYGVRDASMVGYGFEFKHHRSKFKKFEARISFLKISDFECQNLVNGIYLYTFQ
jgi:hypothetical protein